MDSKVIFGLLFCVMACAQQTSETTGEDAKVNAGDDSDMYMEPIEDDHQPASSNYQVAGEWFPSFARSYDPYDHPPSGHSRPEFYNTYHQQEGAYSQKSEPPFQQDVSYNQAKVYPFRKEQQTAQAQQKPKDDASILGDGNFGIIPGGTFYPEKDSYDSEGGGFEDFSSYFHNGHGRPSYYFGGTNPKPVKKQQQFENFRDFADINNPNPERQYSQYVVVYTNKNGTRTTISDDASGSSVAPDVQPIEIVRDADAKPVQIDIKRPKNILESLALLDQRDSEHGQLPKEGEVIYLTRTMLLPSYNQGDFIEIPPEKKISKSKRKLAKLQPEKKHEARLLQKAKDMKEPLLALS